MNCRAALVTTISVGKLLPLVLGRRGLPGWPVAHAAFLAATLTRNADAWGPVAREFRTDSDAVWLTIDDGPCVGTTREYLALLERYHARATFFSIGQNIERARPLAREISRAGHELANHTHSHPSGAWWALSSACVRREIARGSRAIAEAVGTSPRVFRSPVGMTNPWVHPACARAQMRVVGWTASGVDGIRSDTQAVVARLRDRLRPGAIFVLHESDRDADGRVRTLAAVLDWLRSEGMRCVIPETGQLA